MAQTKLSSKGQVVIPKSVREACGWRAGATLEITRRNGGVMLRSAPLPATRLDEVFGMLKYRRKPKTIEEMDEGIAQAVRERHARGRY